MQPRFLQHVCVWLDDGPSDDRVFPQALDWAFRLNLPLRAVVASSRFSSHAVREGLTKEEDRRQPPVVEKMKAWGVACAQRGTVLEICMSLEDATVATEQFVRPYGLCVFVEKPSSRIQEELLFRTARSPEIAVLMCPPICAPMKRMLVLHNQPNPNAVYLESVARLCQALEINPIILIVAKTEREANIRQGYAEGVCSSFRLQADFDFVVGCELLSAVGRVASWRSCSHLIVERQNVSSWWQRMNGDLLAQIRGLSETLSVLALPAALSFDLPPKIRGHPLSLPRGVFAPTKHESTRYDVCKKQTRGES